MDLNLNGKRVILSGGSRGIGLAIAARFLGEGANVAFFARGEAGVQAALEELGSKGEVYGDSVDAG